VLRDFAAPFIATGQLVPLLEQWMHRRPMDSSGTTQADGQNLASLRALIDFLVANQKSAVGAATQSTSGK
jgi:hypothetical protein